MNAKTGADLPWILHPSAGWAARWVPILVLVLALASAPLECATVQAADPPALFVRACAPCHGKDGRAGTPAARKLGVKDMSLISAPSAPGASRCPGRPGSLR